MLFATSIALWRENVFERKIALASTHTRPLCGSGVVNELTSAPDATINPLPHSVPLNNRVRVSAEHFHPMTVGGCDLFIWESKM
jgi:hypothetical protein